MPGYETAGVVVAKGPQLQTVCLEPNAFRRSVAKRYADYVVAPDEGVDLLKKITDGRMTCALAVGCKEQILQWISEGRFDVKGLPVEMWPVSKCTQAFAYLEEKGADVFKIPFDWSKC